MELHGDQKLLIYSIGILDEPLRSRIKLQKLFFLVSNVFKDMDDLFKFEPHLFGPYSEPLDDLCRELIALDLIRENNRRGFRLTTKGWEEFKKIRPQKELKEVISDFKQFINDIPDNELMTFIYACYPDYISESYVWDDLKRDRVKYALDLLKKNKISFSRAVEVSGKNFSDFQRIAKDNNIRWRR